MRTSAFCKYLVMAMFFALGMTYAIANPDGGGSWLAAFIAGKVFAIACFYVMFLCSRHWETGA